MKTDKIIKVTYQYVELSAGELQQRLDDAFDLLFTETMKTFENDQSEMGLLSKNTYGNFIQNNN
ncbi:MAG: hypothetical protein Q8P26_03850 [Candidatus Levybacteria bacterium]|nr:hypothetical protein [Candidatus Levybacteria bacterium]